MEKLPDTTDVATTKPSPQEYQRFLSGLNLLDIELAKCSMEAVMKISDTPITRTFDIKRDATMATDENDVIIISHSYELKGMEGRRTVLKVSATFRLRLTSEQPFTDEYFDIYRSYNLDLHTWPYFRELASELTARSNVPRLTLPLVKPIK